MNGKTILLVEDDKEVQDYNSYLLSKHGFGVANARTLADARMFLVTAKPDAIVLDIGMPDGNGLGFLREVRSGRLKSKNCSPCIICGQCMESYNINQIPVLMLTGFGEAHDVVKGFSTGCDDYLPKPYTFEVLLARLTHLIQKAEQVPEIIEKGLLTLKITSMIALLLGEDLLLTQKEFFLLLLFVQNEDRVMSAEYIYEKVWGQEMNKEARALQQHISNLRSKIEGCGYSIIPVRNAGYRFEKF